MYHDLYIKALLAFKPSMLFDKINRLDWYQNTLHQWIKQSYLVDCTVLEIGCSTGMVTNHLQDIGFTPMGVDLSSNSIQLASKSYPNLTFEQQDVTQISYTSDSFDNIIAASIINLVKNKQKALSEMFRVCKTGGKISILMPNKDFTKYQFEALLDSLKLSGFSLEALKTWNKLAPKMCQNKVKQLLVDAGVEDIKVVSYLKGMVLSYVGVK